MRRTLCFVAGTCVWMLAAGLTVAEAEQLLAQGAAIDEVAEQRPIEEIEEGTYVLSRPEDDPEGALSFQRVTATHGNTVDEVQWLTIRDLHTGERETLGTASHPFWVVSTGFTDDLVPLADFGGDHLSNRGGYASNLAAATDAGIRAMDVRQGWLLTLVDGRRIVVRSAEQLRREAPARGSDVRAVAPTLLGRRGWANSRDLQPGWQLASATGRLLIVEGFRAESQPTRGYNLTVGRPRTYLGGRRAEWADNARAINVGPRRATGCHNHKDSHREIELHHGGALSPDYSLRPCADRREPRISNFGFRRIHAVPLLQPFHLAGESTGASVARLEPC